MTGGYESRRIALLEQALADRERLLGPEHLETLVARSNLAVSYRQAGRTREAVALQEQVLAQCERLFGPAHPNTLTASGNVASAYWQAGRTDDAITLQERLVPEYERTFGPEDPRTLGMRNNLANSYQQAGRTSQAITLLEQVVDDRERLLGPNDRSTLISRGDLGMSYRHAGRIDEAIALLEQVLDDRQRLLGPDDTETLISCGNLATTYEMVGRTDDAIALLERVLEHNERLLGSDNPATELVAAKLLRLRGSTDNQGRPEVANDHEPLSREELQARLQARLTRYSEGDPSQILAPGSRSERRQLYVLMRALQAGGDPDLESVMTLALTHWCRYLVLPAGEDQADLEIAMDLYAELLPDHSDLVPKEVLEFLSVGENLAGDRVGPQSDPPQESTAGPSGMSTSSGGAFADAWRDYQRARGGNPETESS
jgi:tetratricopeptide (TPR) repeat protein